MLVQFLEKNYIKFFDLNFPLNLGFKAGIHFQNKNHTEDWALGGHRNNGHVTH